MKYVYYYEHIGDGIFRLKITRETESNIWVEKKYGEEMISKNTMSTGSGWDRIHYYFETPELLSKYEKYSLLKRFQRKLKLLENCKDENIMQSILDIELPENIKPAPTSQDGAASMPCCALDGVRWLIDE